MTFFAQFHRRALEDAGYTVFAPDEEQPLPIVNLASADTETGGLELRASPLGAVSRSRRDVLCEVFERFADHDRHDELASLGAANAGGAGVNVMDAYAPRCCRTCEYADGGGEIAKKTAAIVDCLNPNSDRFTPEWDHVCRAWAAESEISYD